MRTGRILIIEAGASPQATAGSAIREIVAESDPPLATRSMLLPPLRGAADAGLRAALEEFAPAFAFVVIDRREDFAAVADLPLRVDAAAHATWFLAGDGIVASDILTALRSGFSDFMVPPLRAIDLLPRLLRRFDNHPEADASIRDLVVRIGLGHIVGQSPALIAEMKKIPAIARCDAAVLIAGETGTGKEVFARAIHYLSPRSRQPFVAVNCGAIPPDLVENELFGHEAGAFTSATTDRAGLVEEAGGGTLFLDEADSLPLPAQVKLLRLLQEREFRRLGSRKTCRADFRVVAAASSHVEAALRDGRFRSDLFYRLNVLPLRLPPLRERLEDLPLLAAHFAGKYARQFGTAPRRLTVAALARLQGHDWPGNVRELENVIERAVLLGEGPELDARDLHLDGVPLETGKPDAPFRQQKAEVVIRFERTYLSALLSRHSGNIGRAAMEAGKNRRALFELLRKHRLRARDFIRPAF